MKYYTWLDYLFMAIIIVVGLLIFWAVDPYKNPNSTYNSRRDLRRDLDALENRVKDLESKQTKEIK